MLTRCEHCEERITKRPAGWIHERTSMTRCDYPGLAFAAPAPPLDLSAELLRDGYATTPTARERWAEDHWDYVEQAGAQ